jgi:hypothetical protein
MKRTETSRHTVNQLGLQTLRTVVLIMFFMGITFVLSSAASSSADESFAHYEENADVLKILHN